MKIMTMKMSKSNKAEYEKMNEGFGYNPSAYSRNPGVFSGKMVNTNAPEDFANVAMGGHNAHEAPPHLTDVLANQLNNVQDKVEMRDHCPNCSKFREDCGCKGTCGNCGGTNGACDCSLNQDYAVGDTVRVINPDCDCNGSLGRVVDIPSPSSVTYVVVKPAGGRSVGELVNKPNRELTIDEKYRL